MNKIITVTLFMILLFPQLVFAQSKSSGSIEELESIVQMSEDLYNAGKYEEAIPYVKKALEAQEKSLGKNHPYVATSLYKLAVLYNITGRYDEAEPLYKRTLKINVEVYGKNNPEVAATLSELATLYRDTNRYEEAEPLYTRALSIFEKLSGNNDTSIAICLDNFAELYRATSKYEKAEPLFHRALEIFEKELGKDHPEVATCLNNLASLYFTTARYKDAESAFKRALNITKKVFGIDHPEVAIVLNNLAAVYQATGRNNEAESLHQKALKLSGKTLDQEKLWNEIKDNAYTLYQQGRYKEADKLAKKLLSVAVDTFDENHPNIAESLNLQGLLYQTFGTYKKAEQLYIKALKIREKALGYNDPMVAQSLNNLAAVYGQTGRYEEAESMHMRALHIYENTYGNDHEMVGLTFHNLGTFYYSIARYEEAEKFYLKGLNIRENIYEENNYYVATSLSGLALVYNDTYRYEEAESLFLRALNIYDKIFKEDHISKATCLHNLATLYRDTGRHNDAELMFSKSLEITENIYGKNHPDVAATLNNLALIYRDTARYKKAESSFKSALKITEKVFGKDHPRVATCLNNLAGIYRLIGSYKESEDSYKRSLEIITKAFGADHHYVATGMINLALTYGESQRHQDSHRLYTSGMGLKGKTRDSVFLLLSERQKIKYIKRNEGNLHGFINHTASYMLTDNLAKCETLDAWIRWKGIVAETQGRYIDAIKHSDNPDIKKQFVELINIRRSIAKFQLFGPGKINHEDYKKKLKELEKKKENLEIKLTKLSKNFALEKIMGKADVKSISEILPEDSVYVDFANINIYDFKNRKWDNTKYLAFVLIPGKSPVVELIEIGRTDDVDSIINDYLGEIHKAFNSIEGELHAIAKDMYKSIISPIEPYIKGKKHLYISPDANLNLIPFEVLVTPDNKYLMEDYSINYVAAGRDIVRFKDTTVAKGDVLIMADPDYDLGLEEIKKVKDGLNIKEAIVRNSVSRDAKGLSFERLTATKKEADKIEELLENGDKDKLNVENYQDNEALEEVLLQVKSPRILHLSTHGYFLEEEDVKMLQQWQTSFDIYEIKDFGIENPMLRSGIALAGANASIKEGRDDGLVSAEKILGINLKGTELVVLSACNTGIGSVQSGEGVFGLKRSFILSGAKTVVMSLWSVPSKETTELMIDFYTLMSKGKSKAEALKQAKLNMKKKNPNPFFWGAFVMVGNPK